MMKFTDPVLNSMYELKISGDDVFAEEIQRNLHGLLKLNGYKESKRKEEEIGSVSAAI
ncbi:hypothetical protein A2U01_0058910 [Trifolium medium]|uniref:Uncharacterized protein n=1 Tax=Trifolium medium TaxID=97028 RepID=A0A392RQ53_9FABA|nr:hypothetical protein [Trifolium medium]